jgi:hypothetical protein
VAVSGFSMRCARAFLTMNVASACGAHIVTKKIVAWQLRV